MLLVYFSCEETEAECIRPGSAHWGSWSLCRAARLHRQSPVPPRAGTSPLSGPCGPIPDTPLMAVILATSASSVDSLHSRRCSLSRVGHPEARMANDPGFD